MTPLILGAIVLFVLLAGARAFERASIRSVKALLAWIAALAGLSLALMLVLTGRAWSAIWAAVLFGPMIYQQWQAARGRRTGRPRMGPRMGPGFGFPPPPPPRNGGMTREEAYEVLGLRPGASEAAIKEAHHRLMRAAHPDAGGSDWLAARINQARDVLQG